MATDTGWRSRITRHARRSPRALMANPKNFRTHPPEQRAVMIAVLARYVQVAIERWEAFTGQKAERA